MIRRLTLPIGTSEQLERVATTSRPLGLRGGKRSFHLVRETLFDTPDRQLGERRMTLRLRMEASGRQVLELAIIESVNLQGVVEETVLETPVVEGGLYGTLAGHSELATRIRQVTQSDALRPQVAMDIDREVRELKPAWIGRPIYHMQLDSIIAHMPGAATSLQRLTLLELGPSSVSLEVLGERARTQHGADNDARDTQELVREALAGGEAAAARRALIPHDVRAALLVLRGGEVALVDRVKGLTLPSTQGSGEEVAREYLGRFLGDPPDSEIELVGFAPTRHGGSDLEIWLYEEPPARPAVEAECCWVPLPELMERIGAPRLQNAELISSLLLLVRSEIGVRLLNEASATRTPPAELPVTARGPGVALGKAREDLLNVEMSILDFNQRVLEMAEDESIPLLERFRYLSIFSSNLDEFFVVRVGRFKGVTARPGGDDERELSPAAVLDLIAIRARALTMRQYLCLSQSLLPALGDRGVRIRSWDEIGAAQRKGLETRFRDEIFPLLTPQAMSASPGQPFPRLISLELSLATILKSEDGERSHLAHVPIPASLPRFLDVPDSRDVIPIEDVVVANAQSLFPAFQMQEAHVFRVSRTGDVSIDEDEAESFLETIADEVESRRYKPVVRLEVQRKMPREVRALLLRELRSEEGTESSVLSRGDVFEVDGPLDLTGFAELADLELEGCHWPRSEAKHPLDPDTSIFDRLDQGDMLVFHPYDAFETTVGRFLGDAATDPDVVSIRLTLYRTGKHSPVMEALLEALAQGKDVSVFVELKARFDEESNIDWTHRLKEAGAHVVFGIVGFKTHAKTALVVRKREDGIRRYVHIGTGNYNATTALFYTDLGLMSADPDLGADLNDFFNELTGSSGPPVKQYRRLLVAPNSLRQELRRLIDREIEHAQAGRPARIRAKMNGLSDKKIIRRLYEAAEAGVQIDLTVRAICTLRPGVPGLSDSITVRSLLGRLLEHARIYYFENAGQSEFYIGSADWRARNLRRRVEVITPVDDPAARERLLYMLDVEAEDPRAWVLRADGAYERMSGTGITSQDRFQAEWGH
jgi:polyphosphate kinase